MSCWCGHEPWHNCRGQAYPPEYYPPDEAYESPRRRRRRGPDSEQLEDTLAELADELKQVRRELAELRDKTTER